MPKKHPDETISFLALSGINFPFGSRSYLMKLVKDIVEKNKSTFVAILGNTLAGHELELELKELRKQAKESLKLANSMKEKGAPKEKFGREEEESLEASFVIQMAHALSRFLPVIANVNYHIVIAEKVLDKPLGRKVLEELRKVRSDVRLINDPDAKIPIRMAGVDDIRGLVPRAAPWYSRLITNLTQRILNAFIGRTNSARPPLVLIGGTGTGAYLPFYEGVPAVSVPDLYKRGIEAVTEKTNNMKNMIGCVEIKLHRENGSLRIEPTIYDFRTVVFNEYDFLMKESHSPDEERVLKALYRSSASAQVIRFRINEPLPIKKHISEKRVGEAIKSLIKRKFVAFDEKSNRYEIAEDRLGHAKITLDDFLKDGRVVKHVVESCRHIGCLKTLYHTADRDLPEMLVDADAFIDAGDIIQGIAHDYEYNGELLPIMNGFDKQQIMAARILVKNLLDAFKLRLAKLDKSSKLGPKELIEKCLVPFVFTCGNHPAWATRTRNSLILGHFEDLLRHLLYLGVMRLLREGGFRDIDVDMVISLVDARVIRVGEDCIAEVNGVKFGVKHPFKSRTLSKSQRIQDVVDFIYGAFYAFMRKVGEKHPNVPLVYVGNFHEASAVHASRWGRTVFGVMIGAYLKDTQFENHKDKVVDIGPAKVEVALNKDNQMLYSRVEFVNNISPEDASLVLSKHVKTSMVLDLCKWLGEIYDLPWR